ncbi:MAG: hypothetical protein HY367_02655 [Candidatus Aenigmarchaeota archaeon]|nr:hypothetical protein [Candidatus Aenigmarchaeota archaeon]
MASATRLIIASVLGIAAIMSLLSIPVQGQSDFVSINVTISAVSEITVSPDTLTFAGVSPGANSATSVVSIKNTGSNNVTNIYVNTTTMQNESTNPLAAGSPSFFASTGFVMIRNTTNQTYYHAGRREWNLTAVLAGEVLNLAAATGVNWSRGYYRNSTGNDFLWKVENGTLGVCNNTATVFTIKTSPENSSSQNRDFSSGTVSPSATAASFDWTTFSPTSGPLSYMCVAVHRSCTNIFIYKYDPNTFPACDNDAYLRDSALVPGAETSATVMASVPEGIPAGDTAVGYMTFIGT